MGNKMKEDNRSWEEIIHQIFAKAKNDQEYAARKLTPEWYISFIKSKVLPVELSRSKPKDGCTIIERVQAMAKKCRIENITNEDKEKLGEIIREAFFKSPDNLFLRTTTIFEPPMGMITVNLYPCKFIPVVDALIRDHFKISKPNTLEVCDATESQ